MKWISKQDSLPKKDMHVLATDSKNIHIAVYDGYEFLHDNCDYGCHVTEDLYWMPLPSLPKEIDMNIEEKRKMMEGLIEKFRPVLKRLEEYDKEK